MFYERRIDPSAYLVLWQVGIAGDRSFRRFSTAPAYRQLLVDLLAEHYPLDHPCTIYEAATLAIHDPRRDVIALRDLPATALGLQSTLVLPPAAPLQPNTAMLARIQSLDAALAAD